MSLNKSETWKWKNWEISWSLSKESTSEKNIKILLVHGFGASKKHWRHNQDFLGNFSNCYAIDLLGFGKSSQPSALLNYETDKKNSIKYLNHYQLMILLMKTMICPNLSIAKSRIFLKTLEKKY